MKRKLALLLVLVLTLSLVLAVGQAEEKKGLGPNMLLPLSNQKVKKA